MMKIRGFSFSIRRALGITQIKQKIARQTGVPTSKAGLERKIGKAILDFFLKIIIQRKYGARQV